MFNNSEKSFLRAQRAHWQIAYVSSLSKEDKIIKLKSIETAILNSTYADSTKQKWFRSIETWKEQYEEK